MTTLSLHAKEQRSLKDPLVREIRGAFERDFSADAITIYKQNSVSIRVRVLDDRFEGKSLTDREKLVEHLLKGLSSKARADLTMLLLIAPTEQNASMANMEFNDSAASRL